MDDEIGSSVKAAQMTKRLRRQGDVAWIFGVVFYGCLEFLRWIYWPTVDKWSLFGWLIPFEGLACLLAMVSYESMKSTLKDRGYSGEPTQREQTIALLIQSQDAEGLRLVRGMVVAATVYVFVFGMVVAGVIRTYFFN